jgi:capsular exopolysaccharide synthesis family protein
VATQTHPQLDLRRMARVLLKRAWLIGLLVAVAFVGTYVVSSLQEKNYTARSEVRINLPAGESSNEDPTLLGNEIHTMLSVAVRQAVNLELGPDASSIEGVRAAQIPETDVIQVAVSSNQPEVAAEAANAFVHNFEEIRSAELVRSLTQQAEQLRTRADQLNQEIADLDEQLSGADGTDRDVLLLRRDRKIRQQDEATAQAEELEVTALVQADSVRVIREAGTPKLPTSPTPLRDAGVAAAVALIFGLGLAFLLDQLDNRINTERIAIATGGLPTLGSIPVYASTAKRLRRFGHTPRVLVPPTSAAAEAYRTLATSLRFSSLGKEKRTILVTSSFGGEGKTTVTANLGAVLAESGLRVVIVSADLRRPMIGELLGVKDRDKGLTSAMIGDSDLSSCFVPVRLSGGRSLFVLPTGPLPHEPAVLLGSDEFGAVIEKIKRAGADFILVDCAPVLPVSDPLAASRHVDGVIVLTLHGKTKENSLKQTTDRLRQVDADIIGVVLNGVPTKGGDYGYHGYYGYRSQEQADGAKEPRVAKRASEALRRGSPLKRPAKASAVSGEPDGSAG